MTLEVLSFNIKLTGNESVHFPYSLTGQQGLANVISFCLVYRGLMENAEGTTPAFSR